jgi:hypothetical protein
MEWLDPREAWPTVVIGFCISAESNRRAAAFCCSDLVVALENDLAGKILLSHRLTCVRGQLEREIGQVPLDVLELPLRSGLRTSH